MIAESARMDWGALVPVTYRVHLDEGSHFTRVTEVEHVLPLRCRRDCLRLDSDELCFALPPELVSYEGVREARIVAASSDAADDVIGLDVELLHLLLCLLPHDRLVQEDVIQDTAQGVLRVVVSDAVLDGVADRDTQASGMVGVFLEEAPPYVSLVARRGEDLRAIDLHEDSSVRLLDVAAPGHVDGEGYVEEGCGEGESTSPLPGTCLSREPLGALLLVVVRLRDRGVGLVAACRVEVLPLVEDLGGRLQLLL